MNLKGSKTITKQLLGLISLLLLSACGDGATDPTLLSANSVIQGEWLLSNVDGQAIEEMDAATMEVQSSMSLTQENCTGAVKAQIAGDSKLELLADSSTGCFVEFLQEVLINRELIIQALKNGAQFEVNSDSTLTLKSSAGTLVFVRQ